jgi:hypothetical protein
MASPSTTYKSMIDSKEMLFPLGQFLSSLKEFGLGVHFRGIRGRASEDIGGKTRVPEGALEEMVILSMR